VFGFVSLYFIFHGWERLTHWRLRVFLLLFDCDRDSQFYHVICHKRFERCRRATRARERGKFIDNQKVCERGGGGGGRGGEREREREREVY